MPDGERAMAGRGRPRDPGLDDRVFDAAIRLYAEGGWASLTFEAVARRASVGKASLYARWPTRAELLNRTLEARWFAVDRIDTGSLRGDLTALARNIFSVLTSPYGNAARWIDLDAALHPEVRAAAAPYIDSAIQQGRAIVRRAIARGELAPRINPGLVMDIIVGGVTNHVHTTPARLRAAMVGKGGAFVEALVNLLMVGIAGL